MERPDGTFLAALGVNGSAKVAGSCDTDIDCGSSIISSNPKLVTCASCSPCAQGLISLQRTPWLTNPAQTYNLPNVSAS